MSKFKFLPMATIGLTSLGLMLAVILSGYNFEGGVSAVVLGAILLTFTVISKKLREVTVLLYISAAFLFSGILMISAATCSLDAANSVVGSDVTVVAKVTGESESYPAKSVYVLKTETVGGEDVDVKLRLVSNTSLCIYAGDEIQFTSKVYSVDGFENSLKRYYMSEGIYLGANVYNGDDDITVLKDGSDTFSCKLQLVRDEIKSRIYSVLPNEYGAVAVAMLLGDKSGVSDETLGALKGAGIYHLFAVSGLHLSIWVLGVFNFLKKLGLSNRLNSMLAVLFTFGFMALTGFTPSVSRAGIMLIVLMSGNLFGREAHSLNSLGIALFIILAANPMAAASASLLLSFGATLGIVTLYQSIDKILNRKLSSVKKKAVRRPIKAVVSVFFVSVCASLFTLPVSAAVFGEVCIIGPLTNVLVSFVSTVMMLAAGGIAILFRFPFGAKACAFVSGLSAKYIINVSKLMSNIPFANIKTETVLFGVFAILTVACVTGCIILFKTNRARIKGIIACVACAGIVCIGANMVHWHNLTTLKVMDVDDGICLVVDNNKEKIVIGCGASDPYSARDVIYEVYDKTSPLLIVPDNSKWNSSLVTDVCKSIEFDRVISGETIDNADTIVEPDFKLNPWSNASIEFHKTTEITYAYCVFGSSDLLIIFNSTQEAVLTKHLDADVLICSYYLPDNFDLSSFGSIIISSTEAVGADMIDLYSSRNQNIYSTLGETDFTIEMRENKPIKISYN